MNYKLKQIKAMARESLRGNYSIVIAALLLYTLITLVVNSLSTLLFQNSSTITYIVSLIFSFVISLIMCIFAAGLDYIFLSISRKKSIQISDLFYMFNHHPDRAILAGFVLTILNTLVGLPITLAPKYMPELLTGSTDALLKFSGIVLICLAMSVIVCLPFTFVYFLLADFPEMEAKEALVTSIQLTKKNLGRLFLLECSFIGFFLLSVFTLYISLLFVVPYLKTSIAFLYREAQKELVTETNPQNGSMDILLHASGDDYNSEA